VPEARFYQHPEIEIKVTHHAFAQMITVGATNRFIQEAIASSPTA